MPWRMPATYRALALLYEDYAKAFCKMSPEIDIVSITPEMWVDFSIVTNCDSAKKEILKQFIDYITPHVKSSFYGRTV